MDRSGATEPRPESDGPSAAGEAEGQPADTEAAPVAEDVPAGAFGGFVAGTHLATADGPAAVESLSVGTVLVTAGGVRRPIRWIGQRTVSCHGRTDQQPVRIAAHAFGEGRPERDLLVSPGHGLCLDVLGEVLIPAARLVNGTTLARIALESVTYWHVELGGHDILLAEGQPAESCRDTGHRRLFAAAGEGHVSRSEAAIRLAATGACRPIHEEGVMIEVLRTRLADRARTLGWHLSEASLAQLHLVADGRTIQPDINGLVVRFVLPTEARDVRLVSDASIAAHVLPGSTDGRQLGVAVAELSIDDGLTGLRRIALDDPRLETGFHPLDGQGGDDNGARWRWTDGSAVLPASLWEGCRGTVVFLRITLSCPPLPRWIGPREAAGVVDLAGFRRPQ